MIALLVHHIQFQLCLGPRAVSFQCEREVREILVIDVIDDTGREPAKTLSPLTIINNEIVVLRKSQPQYRANSIGDSVLENECDGGERPGKVRRYVEQCRKYHSQIRLVLKVVSFEPPAYDLVPESAEFSVRIDQYLHYGLEMVVLEGGEFRSGTNNIHFLDELEECLEVGILLQKRLEEEEKVDWFSVGLNRSHHLMVPQASPDIGNGRSCDIKGWPMDPPEGLTVSNVFMTHEDFIQHPSVGVVNDLADQMKSAEWDREDNWGRSVKG